MLHPLHLPLLAAGGARSLLGLHNGERRLKGRLLVPAPGEPQPGGGDVDFGGRNRVCQRHVHAYACMYACQARVGFAELPQWQALDDDACMIHWPACTNASTCNNCCMHACRLVHADWFMRACIQHRVLHAACARRRATCKVANAQATKPIYMHGCR